MKLRGQVVFVAKMGLTSPAISRLERWLHSAFLEDMSLSAEELAHARLAFQEVEVIKQQKRFWLVYGILFVNPLLQLMEHHPAGWVTWIKLGFLILLVALGIFRWRSDRRLAGRYAGNVELLRVLGEREPGLTDRLDTSLETHPLLEAWNRRLGQRALLWRLDQFLSGRGWGKS